MSLKNIAECIRDLDQKLPSIEPKRGEVPTVQEPLRAIFSLYIDIYMKINDAMSKSSLYMGINDRHLNVHTERCDNKNKPDVSQHVQEAANEFPIANEQYNMRAKLATEVSRDVDKGQLDTGSLPAFNIHELLGEGTFAEVYRAEEKTTKVVYAMKSITFGIGASQNSREDEILEEIQAMQELRHHHIVKLAFARKLVNHFELYLQPVAQENLEHFLRKRKAGDEEEDAKIYSWFGCLAGALDYAHQNGVRHKDIAPKNILVMDDARYVMLSDFGLAKHSPDRAAAKSARGSVPVGTRLYWAPECENREERDYSADVFSLGAIYCLLINALNGTSMDDFEKQRNSWNGQKTSAFCYNTKRLSTWLSEQLSDECRYEVDHEKEHRGIDDHSMHEVVFITLKMVREKADKREKTNGVLSHFRRASSALKDPSPRLFCEKCESG